MLFYKTLITIEVLSVDPYDPDTLEDVCHDITEGHYSGSWKAAPSVEVTKEEMTEALIAQHTDPSFLLNDLDDDFDIDDDDLDEESDYPDDYPNDYPDEEEGY